MPEFRRELRKVRLYAGVCPCLFCRPSAVLPACSCGFVFSHFFAVSPVPPAAFPRAFVLSVSVSSRLGEGTFVVSDWGPEVVDFEEQRPEGVVKRRVSRGRLATFAALVGDPVRRVVQAMSIDLTPRVARTPWNAQNHIRRAALCRSHRFSPESEPPMTCPMLTGHFGLGFGR